MNTNTKLDKINNELSSKGIKLRLERRGERLNIRGLLPSKESKDILKDQRISLDARCDLNGLNKSEKLLQLLLLQLQHQQFSWENWSKKSSNKKPLNFKINKVNSIKDEIKKFEIAFFSNPTRSKNSSSTKTTWTSAYKPYLKRLDDFSSKKKLKLDKEIFQEVINSYSENSRSRQQCVISLGAFARFLNIELPQNWKKLGIGYGIHNSQFRELPSDQLIIETFKKINNPRWKFVYGLMATYGLRNHEVFFCDLSGLLKNGDRVIRVLPNTKTGEHQVWPFHPDWVNLFNLSFNSESQNLLPSINTNLNKTTLQQVGKRVSEQFRRYKLPLRPYDLRHAWAVRTIHIGLPDTVSARMMGHSVSIHNDTYHHWITRRDQQKAVDSALSRNAV